MCENSTDSGAPVISTISVSDHTTVVTAEYKFSPIPMSKAAMTGQHSIQLTRPVQLLNWKLLADIILSSDLQRLFPTLKILENSSPITHTHTLTHTHTHLHQNKQMEKKKKLSWNMWKERDFKLLLL